MPQELNLAALLRRLEPGETVFIAGSAGEPRALTRMLVDEPGLAPRSRFVTSFVPGINAHNPACADSGRHMQVFFMQGPYRQAREQGLIEFCPLSYSGIQQALRAPDRPIDSLLVQVSEPDADGLCSLGPSVEFMPVLLPRARRVLGIINPRIPDLPGAPRVSMESFDAVARSDAALAEYDAGAGTPSSERIAAHLASLIPDGASLQIGLGKVPSQLLRALRGHRDLAFHSGMLSDPILELAAAGALRREPLLTSTVAVGSAEFYRRLGALRGLRLEGVDYTHDPGVLAGIPRLYAINSALEEDLLGQVNAEMLNGRYVSGPGGLPDFAHAARRQETGLSIIALPSTDPTGQHSRIVPRLAQGTPATVPGTDVDVVVTEQGVALLRGLDLEQRMQRLVGIAHPELRPALQAEGESLLRQL
jgi:acyl-CoA hydrolase